MLDFSLEHIYFIQIFKYIYIDIDYMFQKVDKIQYTDWYIFTTILIQK